MKVEQPRENEKNEVGEAGNEVKVRNLWIRHAQKQSAAEITNAKGSGLSASAISKAGAERAKLLGGGIQSQADFMKGYVSTSNRTAQTVDKISEGYAEEHVDSKLGQTRIRKELTADYPDSFLNLYDQKFAAEKKKILADRNIAAQDFAKLSLDAQEEIAEVAEEPVIREWLENPDGELAKLYPPEKAAARFAKLFAKHLDIGKKLRPGSKVDLFHVTHKAITEPFLVSGVLKDKDTGQTVNHLSQIGGSLKSLGNWESEVLVNSEGHADIKVKIQGREYEINLDVLNRLLN